MEEEFGSHERRGGRCLAETATTMPVTMTLSTCLTSDGDDSEDDVDPCEEAVGVLPDFAVPPPLKCVRLAGSAAKAAKAGEQKDGEDDEAAAVVKVNVQYLNGDIYRGSSRRGKRSGVGSFTEVQWVLSRSALFFFVFFLLV